MPVRNEQAYLGATLEQLLGQHYPSQQFEILVIDGRSTDDTRAIAESYADKVCNVQVYDNPQRLASSARNIGIRHATGDYVVIIDGHCQIDGPSYLGAITNAFTLTGADCLGRPQPLNISQATLFQRAVALARQSWLGHHPSSVNYQDTACYAPAQSVAVAYRRSLFSVVGPFDESFDACEDVELNHRIDCAGMHCYYSPALAVRYIPRTTFRGLFRQMARYGKGRVRLARKHPDTLSFGSLAPALFLLGCGTGPLLSLIIGPLGLVFLMTMAVYATLLLSVAVPIAFRNRDLRYLAIVPIVFLAIHAGSGYGSLYEFIRPGKS